MTSISSENEVIIAFYYSINSSKLSTELQHLRIFNHPLIQSFNHYQMTYENYRQTMQKIADVEYAIGVLSWDKEVYMPTKGARFRAQQVATLSGIAHELFTDEKFGELMTHLMQNDSDLSENERRNVELSLRDFQREQKLSKDFVIRRSQVISTAFHAWLKAREANDFQVYKNELAEVVNVKREEAELIGYTEHPYDALMDEFEPGFTTKMCDELFADVRVKLVAFAARIHAGKKIDNSFLFKHFEKDKQWQFGLDLLGKMGYDMEAGRQDISAHPFSINFSPEDVRVTTRIDENDLGNMTWSCIHEGGHALYEQGLPAAEYGLPLGKYISLGMHESQSRLWENNVGRSKGYWQANYGDLQALFSEQLGDISLAHFYKGINKVEPNLIRTEADEIHYHFHVLIRFEIEKALIEGSLEVEDLDKIWNEKYKTYLGVEVPDDKQGILQDIHWSHGSFGYFPTYSLGSFYAAQFFAQAEKEMPNLLSEIEAGNTSNLLAWLRENIHQYGRKYSATELCAKVTGEPLNFAYFQTYMEKKYASIYEL